MIHGYSAENETADPADIKDIHGSLPDALHAEYGQGATAQLDLSRHSFYRWALQCAFKWLNSRGGKRRNAA